MNSMFLCRLRASATISGEKSTPITVEPRLASTAVLVPVPEQTSRMRSPGCGSIARTVAWRQSTALPPESTVFVKSYRFATPIEHAADLVRLLVHVRAWHGFKCTEAG